MTIHKNLAVASSFVSLWLSPQLFAEETVAQPTAFVFKVVGDCDYSTDGTTFIKLKRDDVLTRGAVIRTQEGSRADLFFRRTGVVVRLQPETEMKIERMAIVMKNGMETGDTLLDLRAGRIFTVVRSTVAGSVLEIRNKAGRSIVEGSGIGRYIITADGTHVAAEGSAIPIKLVGENGITVIAAGQQFERKDGKMISAATSRWVKDFIELDELQTSSDEAGAAPKSKP